MMSLFGFGKKKEKKVPTCACQCGHSTPKVEESEQKDNCCEGAKEGLCCLLYTSFLLYTISEKM